MRNIMKPWIIYLAFYIALPLSLCAESIKAVLFDLDGVLVNSRVLHFETFRDALKEVCPSMNLSWIEHERRFDGLSTKLKIQSLVSSGVLNSAQGDVLSRRKQAMTIERLPASIKPNKSLILLLKSLKDRGFRLFCCSNCVRSTLTETLRLLNVENLFEKTYSNEDVLYPKPSPDIYKLAIDFAGLSPQECLILEDSKPGRKAAYASKAHVLEVEDAEDVTLQLINNTIDAIEKDGQVYPRTMANGKSTVFHVVIPMAGEGSRFRNVGFKDPKPFIPVGGKKMIEWVINNMIPKEIPQDHYQIKFHLIVREAHLSYGIDNLFQGIPSNITYTYHIANQLTEGAACSVLLAEEEINNEDPLIIVNSDQYLEWSPDEFYKCLLNPQYDGVILTFYQPNPLDVKWSYAKMTEDYLVSEVQEKKWISPHATVGLYGWKKGSDFVEYAKKMISKNIRINNEFYVCPVYNESIFEGKLIRTKLCKGMWGLGVPEDLEKFRKEFLMETQ